MPMSVRFTDPIILPDARQGKRTRRCNASRAMRFRQTFVLLAASALKVGIVAAIHFETLIPCLVLCNARARRAGEGMGHIVHEGDDSLMSFCKTSGPGPPGPFFLATFTKEQPQQGGLAGAAELRPCHAWVRDDHQLAWNNIRPSP